MRSYLTLDKKQQETLRLVFPSLVKIDTGSDEHEFNMLSVSVFDHWLSSDEAAHLLNNADEDLKRKALHYSLNKKIVTSLNTVTFRMKGKNNNKRPVFKKFIDSTAACNYVIPHDHNLPSKFYFRLAILGSRCLYYEGSDYTNHLYYKDESDIKDILNFIDDSGLHVLR